MCAQEQQSVPEVTSSRPCPSEQEISTTLLGEDEAAQLREFEAPVGPQPNIDLATKGRSTTAAAVKRCLRGSNPDGIGTEIHARGIFAGR
jgi:hypothetical protein